MNLLVASNRNQLELAKALEKKKRERERLKRIEVVSQNWWTKMQQASGASGSPLKPSPQCGQADRFPRR